MIWWWGNKWICLKCRNFNLFNNNLNITRISYRPMIPCLSLIKHNKDTKKVVYSNLIRSKRANIEKFSWEVYLTILSNKNSEITLSSLGNLKTVLYSRTKEHKSQEDLDLWLINHLIQLTVSWMIKNNIKYKGSG